MQAYFPPPARVQEAPKRPEEKKKIGILPAKTGAQFAIWVRTSPDAPLVQHHTIARPFDSVPRGTKMKAVCMHHGCTGKEWPDEATLHAQHKLDEIRVRQEVHVFAYWSNDPCGAPDPDCGECKKAKGVPCAAHYGGCLGLIAPAEPKSDL